MKKISILLILLISFIFCYSQTKKKTSTPVFKFTTEVKTLPPNYVGLSPEKTFDYLIKLIGSIGEKDEFEKTEVYETRIKSVYNKIDNKFLYFSNNIYFNDVKYDIDELSLTISGKDLLSIKYDNESNLIYNNLCVSFKFNEKTYESSNAYGAKVTVKSTTYNSYYVSNCNFLDSISETDIIIDKIQPVEAKDLKNNCGFMVVGNLVYPFLEVGQGYKEPTYNEPVETFSFDRSFVLDIKELWIYNKRTGKIYKKIK